MLYITVQHSMQRSTGPKNPPYSKVMVWLPSQMQPVAACEDAGHGLDYYTVHHVCFAVSCHAVLPLSSAITLMSGIAQSSVLCCSQI